ncbi:TetR family transcriptional regulator [Actinocorallia herbida]|uniref:TetR family transcriptional regulator n=1 Tax=Actinocorallia herbida TaxID=58109 RepID=A0A3N1CZ89_9ACTN|nr:TetR/AcrR family transcriptional regulator [Actinocorallia herbida]ROO86595.1 TetR family transcriptional regulator [Actinocorallia herbida]
MSTSAFEKITARRPRRTDARRNYEALLAAARDAFAEQGTEASLEGIARRAEVGIGTLYRNFPTRDDLIEAVYVSEVARLAEASERLLNAEPWDALVAWLGSFVEYVGTKHVLLDALNRDSEVIQNCRTVILESGEPILSRAQEAGTARSDADIQDVIRLVAGIAGVVYEDDDQRDRVLGFAVDGLRPR